MEQTKSAGLKVIMTFPGINTSGYVILKRHLYEDLYWKKEPMESFLYRVTMARYEHYH